MPTTFLARSIGCKWAQVEAEAFQLFQLSSSSWEMQRKNIFLQNPLQRCCCCCSCCCCCRCCSCCSCCCCCRCCYCCCCWCSCFLRRPFEDFSECPKVVPLQKCASTSRPFLVNAKNRILLHLKRCLLVDEGPILNSCFYCWWCYCCCWWRPHCE